MSESASQRISESANVQIGKSASLQISELANSWSGRTSPWLRPVLCQGGPKYTTDGREGKGNCFRGVFVLDWGLDAGCWMLDT
jgi:hypothetical protein